MIVRGRELHLHPRRGGVTHWAYGMLNGALYGIAAESLGRPRTWYGLPSGAGVWAVDYAALPAAGLQADPGLRPPKPWPRTSPPTSSTGLPPPPLCGSCHP